MRSSARPSARLAGDCFVYLPYYVILCFEVATLVLLMSVSSGHWSWSDTTALADYAIMMIICLKWPSVQHAAAHDCAVC